MLVEGYENKTSNEYSETWSQGMWSQECLENFEGTQGLKVKL